MSYIIEERDIITKTNNLYEFYVENCANSTKENLIEDIENISQGKSIINILNPYGMKVYVVLA